MFASNIFGGPSKISTKSTNIITEISLADCQVFRERLEKGSAIRNSLKYFPDKIIKLTKTEAESAQNRISYLHGDRLPS